MREKGEGERMILSSECFKVKNQSKLISNYRGDQKQREPEVRKLLVRGQCFELPTKDHPLSN